MKRLSATQTVAIPKQAGSKLRMRIDYALLLVALTTGAGVCRDREAELLVKLRQQSAAYLELKAKKLHGGMSPLPELEPTIRELGRLRVREAVPDLALLMSNVAPSYFDVSEASADALSQIGGPAALFAVASDFLSNEQRDRVVGRLGTAGELLTPILLSATSSPDELVRRRALRILATIGHLGLHDDLPGPLRLPPGTAAAILPLLSDPSAAVRFEAIAAYRTLRGEIAPAVAHAPAESSLSVRNGLLLAPSRESGWHLYEGASMPVDSVLRALHYRSYLPPAIDYRWASPWHPYGSEGLEFRLLATGTKLSVPEPVPELAPPFWIRLELRNPTARRQTFRLTEEGWLWDLPLLLRDRFGRHSYIRPGDTGVRADYAGSGPPPILRRVDPGAVPCWEFDLVREVTVPRFDGEYTVTAAKDEVPLLRFNIEGMPPPLWVRSETYGMGFDAARVYYADVQLPTTVKPVAERPSAAPIRADAAVEALVTRYLAGDRGALLQLARRLGTREISDLLRARPLSRPALVRVNPQPLAQAWHGKTLGSVDAPLLATDPEGEVHLAFTSRALLRPPQGAVRGDFRCQVGYSRFVNQRWTPPQEIFGGADSCLSATHLLVAPDGALWLVATGGGQVLARRRPLGGDWQQAESCVAFESHLVRGFDAAFDAAGNLQLVWAPWLGRERQSPIHRRIRTAASWGAVEELPAVTADLWDPKLIRAGDELRLLVRRQDPQSHGNGLAEYRDGMWRELGPGAATRSLESLFFERGQADSALVTGDNQELYQLRAVGGALVLARGAAEDRGGGLSLVFAVPEAQGGATYGAERGPLLLTQPALALAGSRLAAAWVETKQEQTLLRTFVGSIPQGGWRSSDEVLLDISRVGGLQLPDLGRIAADSLAAVEKAKASQDRRAEVTARIYLLENGRSFGGHVRGDELAKSAREISAACLSDEFTRELIAARAALDPEVLVGLERCTWTLQKELAPRVRDCASDAE
jgi:hypothetical protein